MQLRCIIVTWVLWLCALVIRNISMFSTLEVSGNIQFTWCIMGSLLNVLDVCIGRAELCKASVSNVDVDARRCAATCSSGCWVALLLLLCWPLLHVFDGYCWLNIYVYISYKYTGMREARRGGWKCSHKPLCWCFAVTVCSLAHCPCLLRSKHE